MWVWGVGDGVYIWEAGAASLELVAMRLCVEVWRVQWECRWEQYSFVVCRGSVGGSITALSCAVGV